MIKGGYKIVNFNGAALSGVAETLPGIYDQIVDDYDKPVMVSGVSLNGDIMDDAYAGVQEKIAGDLSKSVELTVYGGIITVTEDDEVTFVLSKTTAELTAEIGDLEDLDTTEKGSVVGAVNEVMDNFSDYRKILYVDLTGTSDASNGGINTNLNISNVIPVFAVNKTAGGYAKFYEIYATVSGDIKLRQFPWEDLTAVEKDTQYNIRLYYLG